MKYPFKMIFHDSKRALQLRHEVQIGHYFVFVKDNKPSSVAHKEKRLLVKGDDKVLPLINQAVRLEGVTITPTPPIIDPISTVVTERDLYRAEQDVVHLFIAFPNAPKNLRLVIKSNGESFTERALQLINGVAIETLSMLTAGSYSAQLAIENERAFDDMMAECDAIVPENDEYTQDLLDEIALYMAYDRFVQAQYLIESAIEHYPERQEYRLKLLEILAEAKEVEQFEKEARLLYDAVDGEGPLWEKALELWQALSGKKALFPQVQERQRVRRRLAMPKRRTNGALLAGAGAVAASATFTDA